MTLPPAPIRVLAASEALARIDDLAEVLLDCVHGGASVGFMAPLAREQAQAFWRRVAEGVGRAERVLLVAENPDGRVVGTVQLVVAMPDNQPHRADVAKMLVHRHARRQGVAQRLLEAVDAQARAAGKTVLVLDTVTGGDAERLYARCGWQRVGSIPNYALMPDGACCATTYFHKQLGSPGFPPSRECHPLCRPREGGDPRLQCCLRPGPSTGWSAATAP